MRNAARLLPLLILLLLAVPGLALGQGILDSGAAASTRGTGPTRATDVGYSQYWMSGALRDGWSDAGDVDNDNDLDLAICGVDSTGTRRAKLLINNGNGVWTTGASFTGVDRGTIHLGDYDGDGRLDVLLFGLSNSGVIGAIYHNNGAGSFTNINANLRGLSNSRAVWGDLDNDGHLDFVVMGNDGSPAQNAKILIYLNTGGNTFALTDSISGLAKGDLDLADCNLDGRLDLAVMGEDTAGNTACWYFTGAGGGHFTFVAPVADHRNGALRWTDFTGDGRPDLFMMGAFNGYLLTQRTIAIMQPNNTFVLAGGGGGLEHGSWALCDAACNGLTANLFNGANSVGTDYLRLGFWSTDVHETGTQDLGSSGFISCAYGRVMYADFNTDRVPDIFLMGYSSALARPRGFWYYADPLTASNQVPSTPPRPTVTMAANASGAQVTFHWPRSIDDHTPTRSITYELRVGTTPGGCEITGMRADPATGIRRVACPGTQGGDSLWTLQLPPGTYYAAVQAVDGSHVGSPFSPEATITVGLLTPSASTLTPLRSNSRVAMAWGDYDGDGRQDLLTAGSIDGGSATATTLLYRNTVGGLVSQATALPNLTDASVAWGDVDNDGDLDVALCGLDATNVPRTYVYRNNAGTFALASSMTGATRGSLAFADYNGDGKLDLLVSGLSGAAASTAKTSLYQNFGDGTFPAVGEALRGAYWSRVGWADLDRDGDPDALIAGRDSVNVPMIQMYRNDGGTLTPVASGLPALDYGVDFSFFDFDGDGDFDLAMNGSTITGSVAGATTRVYRNGGAGSFTLAASGLTSSCNGAIATGDIDGNGRPDIVYTGFDANTTNVNFIGLNTNGSGTFAVSDYGLPGAVLSGVALGDLDGDALLDVAVGGFVAPSPVTQVFVNFSNAVQTAPAPPTSVTATNTGSRIVLRWSGASDAQTPAGGLSYDVRIGRSANGNQIVALPADSLTGLRRLPRFGMLSGDSLVLPVLPEGDYFYAVQSIDASHVGSTLATGGFTYNRMTAAALMTGAAAAGAGGLRPPLAAWADFDNDGDVDLLVSTGTTSTPANARTRLYRNTAASILVFPTTLPNMAEGGVAWADYDRDGWQDLAIAGTDSTGARIARIYHNNQNGTFTDIVAGLTGVASGSVAWADYDNDGDPDLLVGGTTNGSTSGSSSRIYRNNGNGTFTSQGGITLPGSVNGQAIWADVDRDGDPDAIVLGVPITGAAQLVVCRNSGGFFGTQTVVSGAGTTTGSVAAGDYDNDGDLDLVVTGTQGGGGIVQVYDNDGAGNFTPHGSSLLALQAGRAAWGDYDGDGDLDLAVCGTDATLAPATRIIRNDGAAGFRVIDVQLPDLATGNLAWGHLGTDGRLELALTGFDGAACVASVYQRTTGGVNAPPSQPAALTGVISGTGRASLHWSPATDSKTPAAGLSYDVRLGTSSRGGQIVPLPADSLTGARRLMRGGVCKGDSAWVTGLPNNLYYFTVQAVDPSFAGSTLPAWQTLLSSGLVGVDDAPAALPVEFAIHDVSPNPARGPATVRFDLPHAARVDLAVYDLSGRRVRTLLDAEMAAGRQAARWDGELEDGSRAAAGYYFVRMNAAGHTQTRRLVLMR